MLQDWLSKKIPTDTKDRLTKSRGSKNKIIGHEGKVILFGRSLMEARKQIQARNPA